MDNFKKDPAVQGLLLQQHLELLRRSTLARFINRILFIVSIFLPMFLPKVSLLTSSLAITVAAFLMLLWKAERFSISIQLRALEETLARYTGGEWEDVYIRSRHYSVEARYSPMFTEIEPIVWFILTTSSHMLCYLVSHMLIPFV